MSNLIVGLDPGVSGGIALIDCNGDIKELHRIPIFEIARETAKKKKKQKHVDFKAVFKILDPMYKKNKITAYIEEITHLFGLPSSSNFRLGYSCGVLHAALQSFGDFYLVKPKLWQSHSWLDIDKVYKTTKAGVKKVDPKPTSIKCAKRLYPNESFIVPGGRALHDGALEACLIARFGLD